MLTKKIYDKNYVLYKILFCLVVGSMLGAILANNMSELSSAKINSAVENFFSAIPNSLYTNKTDLFRSEFFKHGKIILFIWLMSFIPIGKIFIALVLFFKGVCYGFSSSVLFSIYKLKAAMKILKYVLPQNFIFVLIIIFISSYSLRYIFQSSSKYKNPNMFEHIFVLVISLLFMFLTLLIQIYFVK